MAAPFPQLFLKKQNAKDRDWVRRSQAVNLIVLALSWLHLGKPSKCPADLTCSTPLSSMQWSVVSRLGEQVADVLRVGVVGPAEMGRGAAKVESLDELVSFLEREARAVVGDGYFNRAASSARNPVGSSQSAGEVVGSMSGAKPMEAKAIEPERLSLPSAPPSFDPTSLLPKQHREVFLDPVAQAEPVDPFADRPPKVRVHASRKQFRELLKRLDASGRIVLAKPDQVREDHLCGAFALVKDAEYDRLILDARPPNSKEITLDAWCKTLASCHTLALQELEPGKNMYFSGTDLKDYYHAFKVTTARAFRNALACPLSVEEAQQLSCFREEHASCPCLSALAMGDNQAVELGQLSHIQLVFTARAFSPYELLVVHGRAPRNAVAAGIVIDDAIFAESAEPGICAPGDMDGVRRLNLLCEEYLQRGLLAHPKKTFRAEGEAEFWGCVANGKTGRVRANPKRMVPLVDLTLRTARLGLASVSILETLAGGWISVLQMRRRMLCLVHFLYEAQRGRVQTDVVRLSAALVEELFVLSILAPLASAEMRALSIPEVFMSDASEWGSASVQAQLPLLLSKEFQRHSLARGAWSKLLTPWKAWLKMHEDLFPADELPDGVPLVSHPLWLLLAQGLDYELHHVKRERTKRHINLIELQAVLEVEKRLAKRRGPCRYLLGSDSQVTLAALVKGRSASPSINKMLQQSLAIVLGSSLYGNYGYVPSLANPSDDPTRGAELRRAVQDLPRWWAAAAAGNFAEFDAWLSALGFDPLQLAGVPFAPVADVDKQRLVDDLLAGLASVQKPERMAKFKEASANLFGAGPADDEISSPTAVFSENSSCTVADVAGCTGAAVSFSTCTGTAGSFPACAEASSVSPLVCNKERSRGQKRDCNPNQDDEKRPKNQKRVRPKIQAVVSQSEQSPTAFCTATVGSEVGTGPLGPPNGAVSARSLPWNSAAGELSDRALKALSEFPASQFVLPNGKRAKKGFVPKFRGFVDLYSGAAGVARRIAKLFGVWVLTVDYSHGPEQDLLQPELQEKIKALLYAEACLGVGMAPECASFSRAVCPPVRSRIFPLGLENVSANMDEKIKRGNAHARFCARLVEICLQLELQYWLENPDSSFLWLLPFFLSKGIGWPEKSYRVDFCRFNTPWRKRTRGATSTKLAGCCELCFRDHEHLVLRGRSSYHRMAWTRVAQVYPGGFCLKLARSMGMAAGLKPLGKQAKLALASCAHAGHDRVGEAASPGPPLRRRERYVDVLLGVQLVNPSTQRLQHKVWADFQEWLAKELSPEAATQVFVCPALAVQMLRSYGVELYRAGHALYELRHLLALVQRLYPSLRAVLSPAGPLVTQWEEINPVQHRQPLPELLYRAMVAVSWMWGWKRFASILLLGFEGIARVGELLRARRGDLVLPSDLGALESAVTFLRIRKLKSMRRGKGRVQHLKIDNELVTAFLENEVGPLEEFLPLFPSSSSTFRSTWRRVLFALHVPKHLQPTPGGLRGGGAIAAYRRGEAIQSIMWRMRLLSLSTLESYLQELAAETFMTKLPHSAKSKIRSAA